MYLSDTPCLLTWVAIILNLFDTVMVVWSGKKGREEEQAKWDENSALYFMLNSSGSVA